MSSNDEGWMFVDAKGFNKAGEMCGTDIEVGVLARPFGTQMVVGDEQWLDLNKPSEELLISTAHAQKQRIAYTIGRASTTGKFANSQGFLAGTTACLLSVPEIRKKKNAISCLIRVEGRVLLKSIKAMSPWTVAMAAPLRDAWPETQSRWSYIKRLEKQVEDEAAKIQLLRASTAERSLQSKLHRCACVRVRNLRAVVCVCRRQECLAAAEMR